MSMYKELSVLAAAIVISSYSLSAQAEIMAGMSHDDMPASSAADAESAPMTMGTMRMQGGKAPADARDPHSYANGMTLDSGAYVLPAVPRLRLADEHNFWAVAFNRFEAVRADDGDYGLYDAQAWFGGSYDRAVIKAEGEVVAGTLEESQTELLYSHAVTAYWNVQAGVRHDSGSGPDRNWLGVGVQGLAPYWFEVDATLYAGEQGRSLLQVEAEYELLLTQRWIVQPRAEMTLYGKSDSDNGIGRGLSSIDAGVRLRYEFSRQFAPYVGVEWQGRFGDTADAVRAGGDSPRAADWVAGLRFWF